jgi:cyclopropane-fatty-acyl-phospholipid synthase
MPDLPSDRFRALQFSEFFDAWRGPAFAVRTLDGWSWSSAGFREAAFVVTFRSRACLDAILHDGAEAALGRTFVDGNLEIQGDISALLSAAEYTLRHSEGLSGGLIRTIRRIALEMARWLTPGRGFRPTSGWHCAACPLDLPAQFFETWLGEELVHSCAVFRTEGEGFEAAQRNSLERTCARLELERDDRLLDLGCGWGTLSIYAAQEHGATAQGIASSTAQAESAAERIARSGAGWRCSVECRDLSRRPFRDESFDKAADVGIFEQVPAADLGRYFGRVSAMLVPGGMFLVHRLTRSAEAAADAGAIHTNLKPEPVSRELDAAEAAGMEIVSLESLEAEYRRTLRIWIRQLRQAPHPIETHRAHRAWMLYLIATEAALETGHLQVHSMRLRRSSRRRAGSARDPRSSQM